MSWAWRSFLGQPRALLLSRLLPIRPPGSQMTTIFGSANLIRSRGYASKSNGDAMIKRHLYVVLDNHKDGFGVHKLDLGDNDEHALDGGTRRLTDPPVLRVELTTLGERVQFAAVGSSIVAIGTTLRSPALDGRWIPPMGGVLIYNTKTAVLTVTAHLPRCLQYSPYEATMAVGNSLYMVCSDKPEPRWDWNLDWVDDSDYSGGSLHCLTSDPLDPVGHKGDEFWGWQHLSNSSPWFWSHFKSPPKLPFLAKYITAHAAHASSPGAAEEHKLFVSIRPTKTSVIGATFSFSTASRKWRRCGEWHLPVVGHAHHDSHLDAWVGLHAVNLDGNKYGPRVTDGYLYAGNVTSSPSKWKTGNEKLFRLDEDDAAGWRHIDAKLVHIALDERGSEYCLMERLRPKEEVQEDEGKVEERNSWGDDRKRLLRLTAFRVERGQGGEPNVKARRLARSYEVSSHSRHFDAQVFWI